MYCATHHQDLMQHLSRRIEEVRKRARVAYLGRSHFPEQRLIEHRASEKMLTRLTVLHWAADWDEIEYLETWAIKNHPKRRKGLNKSRNSKGGLFGPWNCLYLAWTPKKGEKRRSLRESRLVTRLDWSRRLWPDSTFTMEPVQLATELSCEDAETLRAEWETRKKGRRSSR